MAGVKALVIGMGVLLLAGFVVIAVTLINRMSGGGGDAPTAATLELRPGERLVDAELDGGRVLFRIETADGARVEVRNLADGALVGAFRTVGARP